VQKERDEVETLIHLEGAAATLACKWKLSFLSTEGRTVHQITPSASTHLYQLTLLVHLKPFLSCSYSISNAHAGEQMSVNAMSVKFRGVNCEPQWCVYNTVRMCLLNTCEQNWLSPLSAFVQCLWSNAISYNDAKTTAQFLLLTLDFSWAELLFNSSPYWLIKC